MSPVILGRQMTTGRSDVLFHLFDFGGKALNKLGLLLNDLLESIDFSIEFGFQINGKPLFLWGRHSDKE